METGSAEKLGLKLRSSIQKTKSREELWADFLNWSKVHSMAEIGVYRGDFATAILRDCKALTTYYMIDPWRHLQDWNKPANHPGSILENYFEETRAKTDFAASKRVILRGTTAEVIDRIGDGELDFAYIDGDHTLRGVVIDLIRVFPKVRSGGFIGGDDFTSSIWEHKTNFEPTLVFPLAVYFAEAVGATIFALPFSQFCMHKNMDARFTFIDLTGDYSDITIRNQIAPERVIKLVMRERFPRLMGLARKKKVV